MMLEFCENPIGMMHCRIWERKHRGGGGGKSVQNLIVVITMESTYCSKNSDISL